MSAELEEPPESNLETKPGYPAAVFLSVCLSVCLQCWLGLQGLPTQMCGAVLLRGELQLGGHGVTWEPCTAA